jgi:hypothetical protein
MLDLGRLRVVQPPETVIVVEFFEIDLELQFSQNPFSDSSAFTCVRPSRTVTFEAAKQTREILIRREDYVQRDAFVDVIEQRAGLPQRKLFSFSWTNPEVKVKLAEDVGNFLCYLGAL